MAVLTPAELSEIRRECASAQATVAYTKPVINQAIQALEDWFETTARSQINTAINTATAPVVLPAPVKQLIVKFWLAQKFRRGG